MSSPICQYRFLMYACPSHDATSPGSSACSFLAGEMKSTKHVKKTEPVYLSNALPLRQCRICSEDFGEQIIHVKLHSSTVHLHFLSPLSCTKMICEATSPEQGTGNTAAPRDRGWPRWRFRDAVEAIPTKESPKRIPLISRLGRLAAFRNSRFSSTCIRSSFEAFGRKTSG